MQIYSVISEVWGKCLTQPSGTFLREGERDRTWGTTSQSIYLQCPETCYSSNQRCEGAWKIRGGAIANRFVKNGLCRVSGSCRDGQRMPQPHRSKHPASSPTRGHAGLG